MSEASDGLESHQSLANEECATHPPPAVASYRTDPATILPSRLPLAAPPEGFPLPSNNPMRSEARASGTPPLNGVQDQMHSAWLASYTDTSATGQGRDLVAPRRVAGNVPAWHTQSSSTNGVAGSAHPSNAHGGYRGPILQLPGVAAQPWSRYDQTPGDQPSPHPSGARHPSGAPTATAASLSPPPDSFSSSGEDLIRRFTQAVHAKPPGAALNPARDQSPSAAGANGGGAATGQSEAHGNVSRIQILVMNRKTLVANLNDMLKVMHLGTAGAKKVKQERLMLEAKRLFSCGNFIALRHMRSVVEKYAPVLNIDELERANVNAAGALLRRNPSRPAPSTAAAAAAEQRTSKIVGARVTPGRNNPLVNKAALVELSFRVSPFYVLEQALRPPLLFLKPHLRRKVSQTFHLDTDGSMFRDPDARVFLVCQEYNPRAGDQQPVYFPFYNEIEVNDQAVTANTRGVRGVPGSARPVDLTPLLSKRLGRHKIKISVIVNDQAEVTSDKSFAYGLYYGRKIPHEALVLDIKARPHIILEQTKQLAMRAAASDDADDLVISSTAVYSLKDNVMMTRMQIPIRSRACMHIECFDAHTFVMLQDQAETWKCPICNKSITWETLAVDDFFSQILSQAGPDVETVSIKTDGSWSVEGLNSDGTDDESDSDDDGKHASKRARIMSAEKDEVVDLLSDSEDDGAQDFVPFTEQHDQSLSTAEAAQQNQIPNMSHSGPSRSQPSKQPNGQPDNQPNSQPNGQVAGDHTDLPANRPGSQLDKSHGSPLFGATLNSVTPHTQAYREHAVADWAANGAEDGLAESLMDPSGHDDVRDYEELGPEAGSGEHEGSRNGDVADDQITAADVARREIYATIQAFHKSRNLMFEKPLDVGENYGSSTESEISSAATPHVSQLLSLLRGGRTPQQPTPPTQSPPAPTGETLSSMPQKAQFSSAPNYAGISRIINDADEDDDIIDLTSD